MGAQTMRAEDLGRVVADDRGAGEDPVHQQLEGGDDGQGDPVAEVAEQAVRRTSSSSRTVRTIPVAAKRVYSRITGGRSRGADREDGDNRAW